MEYEREQVAPIPLTEREKLIYSEINSLNNPLPDGIHISRLPQEQQAQLGTLLSSYISTQLEADQQIAVFDASQDTKTLIQESGVLHLRRPTEAELLTTIEAEKFLKDFMSLEERVERLVSRKNIRLAENRSRKKIEEIAKMKEAELGESISPHVTQHIKSSVISAMHEGKNSIPPPPLFIEENYSAENIHMSVELDQDNPQISISDEQGSFNLKIDASGPKRPRTFLVSSLSQDEINSPSEIQQELLFARIDKHNPMVTKRRSREPKYSPHMTREFTSGLDPTYESTFWINNALLQASLD